MLSSLKVIDKSELESKRKFTSSKDSNWPIDAGLVYACMLLDFGFYPKGSEDVEANGFKQLSELINKRVTYEDILLAEGTRKSPWTTIERDLVLSGNLQEAFLAISGRSKSIYIEWWPDNKETHYWKVDLEEYIKAPNLIEEFPENYGTYFLFDEESNWFLHLYDISAFNYVVTTPEKMKVLTAAAPDNLMLFTPSFKKEQKT